MYIPMYISRANVSRQRMRGAGSEEAVKKLSNSLCITRRIWSVKRMRLNSRFVSRLNQGISDNWRVLSSRQFNFVENILKTAIRYSMGSEFRYENVEVKVQYPIQARCTAPIETNRNHCRSYIRGDNIRFYLIHSKILWIDAFMMAISTTPCHLRILRQTITRII